MKKETKHCDNHIVTVYRMVAEVILGKSGRVHLYVNANDYDNENEYQTYYYDEDDSLRYVIELGKFQNLESAESKFAEVMRCMADECYDGIIELYV